MNNVQKENDELLDLNSKTKFKPKFADWLILTCVLAFVVTYSAIFANSDFSTFQTIGYILLGMFLMSFIVVLIRVFYSINSKDDNNNV